MSKMRDTLDEWEKMLREAQSSGLMYDDEGDDIHPLGEYYNSGNDWDYTSENHSAASSSSEKPNQRWCKHEWYGINLGFGPMVYNCKKCDMKKEDYEKEQLQRQANNKSNFWD